MSRPSVAPPGWAPSAGKMADGVAVAAPALDRADAAADAAVRWRIGAAFIDNIIVYGGYLVLCGLLGWRVGTLSHLLVLIVAGIAYHFAWEARGGQTPGKRRYGIRVVSIDGEPASAQAIGIRSVLRIVDQLPVLYVSGLISMVRTGPRRRQRIGDVAAHTMVVAVDRHAAAKGTPGWMLPAATIGATLVSAACVLAVVQAGDGALTATHRAQFIAGCQNSSGGQLVDCGCVLNELEAAGYDTPNSLRELISQAQVETVSNERGASRTQLANTLNDCRR